MKNAYEQLTAHFQQIGDLQHVGSIVSWDEAAMMPAGGGQARGAAMATLSTVIHQLTTDERIGDWLDHCSNLDLDDWQKANLREIRRTYENNTCLPEDLVRAQSLSASASEQTWREARANNDWHTMQPLLTEVVRLAREEAQVRSEASGLGLYDSLLDTYEPDMRSARIDKLFSGLKTFLPEFVGEVIERQSGVKLLPLGDHFPIDQQRELGISAMQALGFDFSHGRLDVSHHPFCGGVQEDVRITTRYSTDNFVESLMSVIHETGHAMYEQGRPTGWSGQPVSEARSSGVHESQSLLMEMQAARSQEFLSHLAPLARRAFGIADDDPAWSGTNLFHHCTRVERGLIRVDADETTYPLHVILRYEIEKALIEGSAEVNDLPDMWNEKMMAYL
ncbi:MAG: carboxypeptidase M32, partial [Pseudomonadales bacterium]|nr:carboxypeptidase M32 [Pseudomonadales bacterium]